MLFSHKSIVLLSLLSVVPGAFVSQRAQACPCITLVGTNIEEVAQRALVVVEPDSLDYVLQLAVEGEASELGWLVPTPAVADDPVLVDSNFLEALDFDTAPWLSACSSGGGLGCAAETDLNYRDKQGVTVWSEGMVGDLEFAVVSATDGSDLSTWLQARNYSLSSAAQDSVDDYVSRGWSFVALRVAGEPLAKEQPSLGPIWLHIPYSGTPVFPLGMTALSGSTRVGMLIFVAAQDLLKPENYPLVSINGDDLVADEAGESNYAALATQAIDAQGKGFLLEYASGAPSLTTNSPTLDALLRSKKMVRLYTDIAPSKLDQDLQFVVDNSLVTPTYKCVPSADEQQAGGCAALSRPLVSWLPLLGVVLGLLVYKRQRKIKKV